MILLHLQFLVKKLRITLGNLVDRDSKIRIVLDAIPKDKIFHKAYFNDKLPQVIIENRQPIKAALDVLEEEGYVKKTGNHVGISEEYIKTNKVAPPISYHSLERN